MITKGYMKIVKILILLVVIACLFLVVIFLQENYNIIPVSEKNNEKGNFEDTGNVSIDNNGDIGGRISANSISGEGGGGGSGGAGGGGGGGEGGTGAGNINRELPNDINTTNCGFYYSEYNVCAGTCPEGKCTGEGRSCYCKK